jgi:Protein of unknown function (DUF732)
MKVTKILTAGVLAALAGSAAVAATVASAPTAHAYTASQDSQYGACVDSYGVTAGGGPAIMVAHGRDAADALARGVPPRTVAGDLYTYGPVFGVNGRSGWLEDGGDAPAVREQAITIIMNCAVSAYRGS